MSPATVMPMRRFLAALACLLAAPVLAQDSEVRACWLTQYAYLGRTDTELRAMAEEMKEGGLNTVYVAMYAGAQTLWPSQAYLAAGGTWQSASTDHAERLTRIFGEEGLAVGA